MNTLKFTDNQKSKLSVFEKSGFSYILVIKIEAFSLPNFQCNPILQKEHAEYNAISY